MSDRAKYFLNKDLLLRQFNIVLLPTEASPQLCIQIDCATGFQSTPPN